MGLPFLPVYAWTGLWSSLFLGLGAVFSSSNVVLLLTRFTDEIFANLISLIFVYEAIATIGGLFVNQAIGPAYALTALVAACTTYISANTLAGLRQSRLFNKKTRDTIASFGPTIGVAIGCCVA